MQMWPTGFILGNDHGPDRPEHFKNSKMFRAVRAVANLVYLTDNENVFIYSLDYASDQFSNFFMDDFKRELIG